MPKRKVIDQDYVRRRALPLPDEARFDWIMRMATSGEKPLPALVTDAMRAIEEKFDPLKGVLPKDYGIFEPQVLEDLMRLFNSEQIRQATGDVFGRIYEYFLARFSIQKAHDNGEFFTPSSLVQMLVNVIEPDHGKVFDPACGSGGMFVQSSHFIEHEGGDTAKKVVFYGQEKNPDTIRIAKMNLAVHGLTGEIGEAITYYEDQHNLVGGADFVMANPPFNVDLVDAERIKTDTDRLPFGLPGINKQKKVSNGNYLWISYFWSYLNKQGRAGFVMSSQASSSGHGEKDVRERIVRTGDVDVMMSIRSNFFYTRTVPCELWFFDRGKAQSQRDHVLMVDARNVYRKVNRTINDFAPEQMTNLSAMVWLYRGQKERFIALVQHYLHSIRSEVESVEPLATELETTLDSVRTKIDMFVAKLAKTKLVTADVRQPVLTAASELGEADVAYRTDQKALVKDLAKQLKSFGPEPPATTKPQLKAAEQFAPLAERVRGLVKQIDLLCKLAGRVNPLVVSMLSNEEKISRSALAPGSNLQELDANALRLIYDRREVGRELKQLDEIRVRLITQLRRAVYFHRQATWLLDRFPHGKLTDVPGLVKLVSQAEMEAADWSLTPGRYVGVAPAEVDEDFDFEQTMHDIHVELADLNEEAVELAAKIQTNYQEMVV